ncbi:MAG TPA: SAM-dependent methyltransferase [Bryobacteraceae bacterium]|nr:SAM-dependent methyltransferase [Bryobacteraceae bacterium]
MPNSPKPGIDDLLVRSALDAELRRRFLESPEAVLLEFDLSEEEKDILRKRDHRILELLGAALGRQRVAAVPAAQEAEATPFAVQTESHMLPDLRLAVTVVPCVVGKEGEPRSLTFAAWANPLEAGTDPATLPAPRSADLPGQPLAPLHVVLQISGQQLPSADGMPNVGLSASLLQSTNMFVPPEPQLAGRPECAAESGAPDIWIVGLGMQTATQVTGEVEQAIRGSQEVLYVDTGVATRSFLCELCPRVTPLYDESYQEEHSRPGAYEHMAEQVLQAAMDHPPVTFAIHGHPLVAALPPFRVMELAKARGLRVRVLPGVSAIDTIMADLRLDPVVHGIQMYEATDLLLRRRPLQPDVPALIWQIGPLETCLHTMRVSRPERFDRFIAHLRLFYPAGHEVVAIYCSPHALMQATILRFALEEMGSKAPEIHSGFSLYIPPVSGRPIHDHDLLKELYSVDHLKNITGVDSSVTE